MDKDILQMLFSVYRDRFDELNDPTHAEYFKWVAARKFKPAMDKALAANSNNFSKELYEVKKVTSVLIDGGHTQPFYGLIKFAEKEPETVREMFKKLYTEDYGDVQLKQDKMNDFITQSRALRDKYYYNSHLYTDDLHSVSAYLFLYDPDHNYLYKYSHGREFAEIVAFGDDWGSGKDTKLNIYYKMCDQLVEAMKEDSALMELDHSRYTRGFAAPEDMHPDLEKHILAFDMIYCICTYGLGDDIELPPGPHDKRAKALELFYKWQEAQESLDYLNEAKEYTNSVFKSEVTIHHITYGEGIVQNNTGSQLEVSFNTVGLKKIGTFTAAAHGLIIADVPGYDEIFAPYADILNNEDTIKTQLSYAKNNLLPYLTYLSKSKVKIFEKANS